MVVPVVAVLLFGVVLLGGCAAPGLVLRPVDYPLHVVSPPLVIHWRLTAEPGVARADGLLERQTDQLGAAVVQLIGEDAGGRIVSFSQPLTIRWHAVWDTEPFAMALTPRGGEQRYDVRVMTFQYKMGVESSR